MMRFLYGIGCASVLFAVAGCSDAEPATEDPALIAQLNQLNQNTEFRLDGAAVEVNRYEVLTFADEANTIILAARGVAYTCAGGDPNNQLLKGGLRADLHIANPAALPLGMAVDVGAPEAPIQAVLSAVEFDDPCLFWEGSAQGTVTIDSVELHGNPAENVIRGSFDLRAEDAAPQCDGGEPKLIEIRWTSFEPTSASSCN